MGSPFLHLSIADWVNDQVTAFVQRYGDAFHNFSVLMLRDVLVPLESLLRATPPLVILAAVGLLGWHASRRVGVALLFVVLLWLIGCFGLWDKLMQTFALMVVATVISVVLGVPLGILAASSS